MLADKEQFKGFLAEGKNQLEEDGILMLLEARGETLTATAARQRFPKQRGILRIL